MSVIVSGRGFGIVLGRVSVTVFRGMSVIVSFGLVFGLVLGRVSWLVLRIVFGMLFRRRRAAMNIDNVNSYARYDVWNNVRGRVRAVVFDVHDSVWDGEGGVWASIRNDVWEDVWFGVWDDVWASVRGSVEDSVWDGVRDDVRDCIWRWPSVVTRDEY
jgi:hypothetical protein